MTRRVSLRLPGWSARVFPHSAAAAAAGALGSAASRVVSGRFARVAEVTQRGLKVAYMLPFSAYAGADVTQAVCSWPRWLGLSAQQQGKYVSQTSDLFLIFYNSMLFHTKQDRVCCILPAVITVFQHTKKSCHEAVFK